MGLPSGAAVDRQSGEADSPSVPQRIVGSIEWIVESGRRERIYMEWMQPTAGPVRAIKGCVTQHIRETEALHVKQRFTNQKRERDEDEYVIAPWARGRLRCLEFALSFAFLLLPRPPAPASRLNFIDTPGSRTEPYSPM